MICEKCGKDKKHKAHGMCEKCYRVAAYKACPEKLRLLNTNWRKANPEKARLISKRASRKQGTLPMSENRECTMWLGVHVAEQVLSNVFKNVDRMPPNYPGYDFICNKGKKIDVKSACLTTKHGKLTQWAFVIKRNEMPDFFLCIAFDNRKNLTPLHLWLIPGKIINHLSSASISISTLGKWQKYELDLTKTIKCCNKIKIGE